MRTTPPISPASLPKLLLHLCCLIAGAYIVVCIVVALMQDSLLFFPTKSLDATPDDIGLPFREVAMQAGDGTSLHGWWCPGRGRGAVIWCHGNAGNISHRLESMQMLHDMGLSSLFFDYRGYGRSDGHPNEDGMAQDAEAAWEWVVEKQGVESSQVIIYGRSLGGAVAARLASHHQPAGLVCESTFTSLADEARSVYPWLPVRLLCRYRFDAAGAVSRVSCPKLFIHSRDDEIVPHRLGRRLYESAREPKEFLETRGGHNDLPVERTDQLRERLQDFIRRALAAS